MEVNFSEALEQSLDRLKRNRDIWDNLIAVKSNKEVLVKEDGRKHVPFKHRRVYDREDFTESCWYKFMKEIYQT